MAAASAPADHPLRHARANGETMTHVLDPSQIGDDSQYCAALDELEDLMLADPGTPAGRRFDELARLIEEYEVRRDGYDIERIKQALAANS
jgi:hypothetical protein